MRHIPPLEKPELVLVKESEETSLFMVGDVKRFHDAVEAGQVEVSTGTPIWVDEEDGMAAVLQAVGLAGKQLVR